MHTLYEDGTIVDNYRRELAPLTVQLYKKNKLNNSADRQRERERDKN